MIGIAVAVVIGAIVALAGSDGSTTVGWLPVFALCAGLAYLINWLVFIPSNMLETERYFDLTGSLTYLTVTAVALLLNPEIDARAWIAGAMVAVWAARLGTFLFRRIRRDGRDGRFDEIKRDSVRFLMTWTLQGLWVLLTAASALAIMTSLELEPIGWVGLVGIVIWIVGFTIEVVADRQKSHFKADPANAGRFISTGLWSWSRHPNYFGEITLWLGMTVLAVPILSGWRWIVLISPVFVALLLTRISGIPMLERRAEERWGADPEFQAYTAQTSVLIPLPPR
jgi:steroid 5-alpha reductase family enzyme